MANDLQMNLGALRSSMQLTLHTHHAARVWHGRLPSEGRPGIIGLSGFVGIVAKMKRGTEQDDPYSDWWMLRIEEKLVDSKARLKELREQIDQVLKDVNPALSLGANLNVLPVKLPVFVNSQHGFMAIYLLADFDELARNLILAHHIALIDRSTMERFLNEGSHLLRSTFTLAQQYRYSGTQRDDYAANNAAARAARERFGELPQDVLEGTRRSRFAPPIVRRSALSSGRANTVPLPPAAQLTDDEEITSPENAATIIPDEEAASGD